MDKPFILLLIFQLVTEVVGCSGIGSCFYVRWYFWFGLFWLGFAIVVMISYCCRKYKQRNQVNAMSTANAAPPKPTQAPGPPPYTAQSVPPPAYSQYNHPHHSKATTTTTTADPAYPPGIYPPPPPPTYTDPAYPPQ